MIRKYLCWLLGHSFICLFRYHWGTENRPGQGQGSESTGWKCQHCGKQLFEQWDS